MLTPSSPSPARRQPLVHQVSGYLQQQIMTGTFPVGSKLPPAPELMATLAVWRSTLRDAMRVLAHTGLVDVLPDDGTYIRWPTPEAESPARRLQRARVIEVYEVRHTLALECARLLQSCQALRNRRKFLPLAREQTAFADADLAFHTRIANVPKTLCWQTSTRPLSG